MEDGPKEFGNEQLQLKESTIAIRTIIPIEENKEEVEFDPRDITKRKDEVELSMEFSSNLYHSSKIRDSNGTYDTQQESEVKQAQIKVRRDQALSQVKGEQKLSHNEIHEESKTMAWHEIHKSAYK